MKGGLSYSITDFGMRMSLLNKPEFEKKFEESVNKYLNNLEESRLYEFIRGEANPESIETWVNQIETTINESGFSNEDIYWFER